jgi:hypothetical protein
MEPRCRGARSGHLGGRWSVSGRRGGNWALPSRQPRVELVAVGDTHEVAVPHGLKVQVPESDLESGWEGV